MLWLLCLFFQCLTDPMILFKFDEHASNKWSVVDDGVMGGLSQGHLSINEDGIGIFHGEVSLENNGGFSSMRLNLDRKNIGAYTELCLRIKGDGKSYQFRIKSSRYDRHSYVYSFTTSGEWESIIIPLREMRPRFRGRNLNMPNYDGEYLEEVAFLISNKKAEHFQLMIDQLVLQ